jgi:endonuclease YncB( thermonuclease family)
MNARLTVWILAGWALLCPGMALAGEAILTGHARTIDGDTIEIGGVSVRLKGIAAPERDEPGGPEATQAMRALIGDRDVRCALTGERTHGRAVGFCSTGNVDLNGSMVRGGWALSCPHFSRWYVGTEPQQGTVQRIGYHLPPYCLSGSRKGG